MNAKPNLTKRSTSDSPDATPGASPSTAGSRRELRRVKSRARILAAAEQVFAETGFSGATTAMIAARARLPKANVHYYFGTKEKLYRTVLERILDVWLASGDGIRSDADPATALADYIAAKIEASHRQPYASKVFANEILHGAPQVADYLSDQLRRWVEAKAAVIEGWVARGLMQPVDVPHFFFVIWAATQTYADFESQIRAVLKRDRLKPEDFASGARLITRMVLRAGGIASVDGRSDCPAALSLRGIRSRPGDQLTTKRKK
ncbi:MAG: TetR/AcrR family transcriptional regulator [Rhodospirillaceae bacterium]|jgi:TetR/AcrR family transcriptional regulator|nr:TetR/AcrR family transcriptional regulator [Rhodospirillaceae bacterium]